MIPLKYKIAFAKIFLSIVSICAQNTVQLSPDDYDLWRTLERPSLSHDGKWISYYLRYKSRSDTLFLKNRTNKKKFSIPLSYYWKFSNDNHFAAIDKNNQLTLINLKTEEKVNVEQVKEFEFVNYGQKIIVVKEEDKKNKTLEIKNVNGGLEHQINDVSFYSISPCGNKVVYVVKTEKHSIVEYFDIEKKITKTIISNTSEGEFVNPIWQKNGNAISFVLKKEKPSIIFYDYNQNQTSIVSPSDFEWSNKMELNAFNQQTLLISDDGKKVFFFIEEKTTYANQIDQPVHWKTDDIHLSPTKKGKRKQQFVTWWPNSNQVKVIADNYETIKILVGNQDYAITADIKPYSPTFKLHSDEDIYVTNLNTGEKKVVIKQYVSESPKMQSSPSGNFIAYFKEANWWVYDVLNDKHIIATDSAQSNFQLEQHEYNTVAPSYGFGGWSPDEKIMYVYDKFDIWACSINDKTNKRLTKGKEKKLQLRFHFPLENNIIRTAHFNQHANNIDLKGGEILYGSSEDFEQNGYFLLHEGKVEDEIVVMKQKLKNMIKAQNNNGYIYTKEDTDLPPVLVWQEGMSKKKQDIFHSNKHYVKYGTSKSVRIEYNNSEGKKINGILFYPFNYNPNYKYPMVVYIYEKLISHLHLYVNPTVYEYVGFNLTDYTSQGYFVLYPDIHYQLGKAPFNATDQVIAATKKAVSSASIDASRIGLIGHSFGGYQTNFIISQTNLFTCAVSGSSVVDNVSSYLSYSDRSKVPRYFMYEYHQQRIPFNLFDNWENYLYNSPIYYAKKIETPLLTWSGDNDTIVPHTQTMMLYFALRRLNKKNTMILYPNEGHFMSNPKNQKDLSVKIKNWFDYYLKDKPLMPEL